MFIPQVYAVALLMMVLSMIAWGSWANTQKLTGDWRFELFYWDYVWGILLCAVLIGLTLGRTDAASPDSFFHNLSDASARNLAYAFAGGIIFNVANMLLVAAIAIAGLAVAFPIGIGLALAIGSVLNYIITPKGNPLLLFSGIALVVVAIVVDALAYRRLSGGGQVTQKGIALSLLCGVGMGLFYRQKPDRRRTSGPLRRGFCLCAGRAGIQLPSQLRLHAPPRERTAACSRRLSRRPQRLAPLGSGRGIDLGNRDDFELRRVVRQDGGPSHVLRARPGRHDGFRDLGRLCVEGVSWRGAGRAAPARLDVPFVCLRLGVCRFGAGVLGAALHDIRGLHS